MFAWIITDILGMFWGRSKNISIS